MPFLAECGENHHHQSWAHSGIAASDGTGACPDIPECAVAFHAVAMGYAAQRGCHCPVLLVARRVSPRTA